MQAVRITSATGRTGRVMRASLVSRSGPSRALLEELRRDHHLLNLGRAYVDLGDARVSPVALDVELAQVAVAAVNLNGQMRATGGGLRGVPLGDRCFLGVWAAGVAQPRRPIREPAGALHLDRHVREHLPDRIELADRAVELLALAGIAHRRLPGRLRD